MEFGRPAVKIDATNVLSILQKAEKDKVDALVEICIRFVRGNLQELVNHQGSVVETLSDDLVQRIALRTHHGYVELLRDKKDRIKTRLFRHLTERLLDGIPHPDLGSPESADRSFQCQSCHKVLNPSVASRVKCSEENCSVDESGDLVPRHSRNENWNANFHVRSLQSRYKCWRRTYWKLWGEIHFLTCSKCEESFSCIDIGSCKYHPDGAQFPAEAERNASGPIGHFPCCQQTVSRFDPWELNGKGCRKRDHTVNPSNAELQNTTDSLFNHREIICLLDDEAYNDDVNGASTIHNEGKRIAPNTSTAIDETCNDAMKGRPSDSSGNDNYPVPDDSRSRSNSCNFEEEEDDDGSESDTITSDSSRPSSSSFGEDEEEKQSNDDPTSSSSTKEQKIIWDATRSRRHNHDVLREHEQQKFREMISSLCRGLEKERLGETRQTERCPDRIYARLEAKWKETIKANPVPHSKQENPLAFKGKASVMAIAKFKQIKKTKPAT